jgi:hypothetical protein
MVLASAVRFSWFRGEDRGRVVVEDQEKIDEMIGDLYEKASWKYFESSNLGLRLAMREFWVLSNTIENARLKPI